MSEPQSPQPRNRSRSSPAPIVGRGQSSAAILPLPRNTAAFTPALSFAAISPLASSGGRPHLAPPRAGRLGSHGPDHFTARLAVGRLGSHGNHATAPRRALVQHLSAMAILRRAGN